MADLEDLDSPKVEDDSSDDEQLGDSSREQPSAPKKPTSAEFSCRKTFRNGFQPSHQSAVKHRCLMFTQRGPVNWSKLHFAVWRDDLRAVRAYVQFHQDKDEHVLLQTGYFGETALLLALRMQRAPEMLEQLLKGRGREAVNLGLDKYDFDDETIENRDLWHGSEYFPMDEAVHYSDHEASLMVTQLLLANGADVNREKGFWGITPLEWAVFVGHVEVVRLLLENGATVKSEQSLFKYVYSRSGEMVTLLLEKFPDSQWHKRTFERRVRMADEEAVRVYTSSKSSLRLKVEESRQLLREIGSDNKSKTSEMCWVEQHRRMKDMIKSIAEEDSEFYSDDSEGRGAQDWRVSRETSRKRKNFDKTPTSAEFHWAKRPRRPFQPCHEYATKHRALMFVLEGALEWSKLHFAVYKNNLHAVKAYVEFHQSSDKAVLLKTGQWGETALQLALRMERAPEMIRELLRGRGREAVCMGLKPYDYKEMQYEDDEYTYGELHVPINEAANYRNEVAALQVTEMLLECGADVNHESSQGHMPIEDAAVLGHSELMRLLLRHGARLRERELFSSLFYQTDRLLEFLLQHFPESTEQLKRALLHVARMGHWDSVQLLLQAGVELSPEETRKVLPEVGHTECEEDDQTLRHRRLGCLDRIRNALEHFAS